uniref:Carboxypeptidase n=1 Tax=Tanacetum cinerariifolium TaxID=118510 RepID=A0A6L2KWZ8_TANCI|nr:serine carboxypeptidase-like [Tanacetum cinerariifolium]
MATPHPQILYLIPLILLVFISSSYARTHPLSLSSFYRSKSLKKTSFQLIKDLNLHPHLDVNIVKSYNHSSYLDQELKVTQNGIVEKRLSLSVLGDSATVHDLAQHAGYYRIENTVDARMFYFFFESRRAKSDPVVIWLTGGPGCSSELALFYENGPFKVTNNLSLVWNDYGWDQVSNLIYVDQPTGTGFSYSSSDEDIRHDETGVSNDLYFFLQAFFKAHPDYVNNDFFITGESYAGHYIPAFASRVNKGNINKEGIHINLKGFGIGNGLTDPAIQYKAYTDYALANSLISQSDYSEINQQIPDCEEAIKECGTTGTTSCIMALEMCQPIFDDILQIAGNINYYDIRKQCEGSLCYDFSNMEDFLSESSVKTALDGKEAGIMKNYGPLTFLKVHNAGHMVPMDQPSAALQMLQLWTTGKLTPQKRNYSSSDEDIRHDETGVSNDLYFFLQLAIVFLGTTGTTSCIIALEMCQPIFEDILQIAGNINYYDIRKQCEGELCYDFSNMEDFLSESSVKTALGVPSDIDFVSCSRTVYDAMLQDWMRDLEVGIPALLEQGIELLVYAGEYDLICNWVGNSRWVNAMPWSGQNKFVAASNVSFVVDGKEAGIMKNYGPLTFLKVHNAGHMVPMDQPSAALQMLQLWTTGKLTPQKRK